MQYQRFTPKLFGETASATGNDPEIAQFGSALAGTYLGTSDPETIQNLPAWANGFISAVTPSEQFPPLPETTGALKVFSYLINTLCQQGVAQYDSGTDYYSNNWCSYNVKLYRCLADNTTNTLPTDTTKWECLNNLIDGQWTSKTQTLSNNISTGTSTINLGTSGAGALNYLPDDNNKYMVYYNLNVASKSNNYTEVYINGDIAIYSDSYASSNVENKSTNGIFIVDSTRTISFQIAHQPANTLSFTALMYRRIGTNS